MRYETPLPVRSSLRGTDLLADQYAEKLYGINTQEGTAQAADEDDDSLDIEASIRKEIGSLKAPREKGADQIFKEIRTKEDCLLFMRTNPPVKPVELVKYICTDIKSSADGKTRKTRYLNRLTPVTIMGRATMSGVEDVARQVLSEHFVLRPAEEQSETGKTGRPQGQEASPEYSVGYGRASPSLHCSLTLARPVCHSALTPQPQSAEAG